MLYKVCDRCHKSLPLSCFCKNRRQKDGLNTWCRECAKEYKEKYYNAHKEEISRKSAERYKLHAEEVKARVRAYWAENREILNKKALEYQKANREQVYARQNAWAKKKRETDIQFRLRYKIRKNLASFIRGKAFRAFGLPELGCSLEEFKAHIISKFSDGMTWESYGLTWTVDHIVPLTAFDLTDQKQLEKACNYLNTQPLSASDNTKKGGIKKRR